MKAVMLPVLLLAAALQYNSVSARDLTSATMVVTPNRPPKTFTAVGNLGPVQVIAAAALCMCKPMSRLNSALSFGSTMATEAQREWQPRHLTASTLFPT